LPHNKISKRLMLIPKHCAEVAVINAGEGFSPEETIEELVGKPMFYLTKYVILREREGKLRDGERASIVKVRTEGRNLLRMVAGGEVLAYAEKCRTLNDSTIDESMLNQVVLRAASAGSNDEAEAVILSGRNENITFVFLGDQDLTLPLKILLVDATPPRPSRLETLTRAARASRLISKHIEIESLNVDTTEMIMEALRGGRPILTACATEEFLNPNRSIMSFKTIVRGEGGNKPLSVDLIGCSLSQAVLLEFRKSTGLDLEFSLKDICPLHAAREVASRADVQGLIVRCCKMIDGILTLNIGNKPLMVLPWAPSLGDFMKAINDIVRLVAGLEVE